LKERVGFVVIAEEGPREDFVPTLLQNLNHFANPDINEAEREKAFFDARKMIRDASEILRQLHKSGLIHKQPRLHQFAKTNGQIKIFDFETSTQLKDIGREEFDFRVLTDVYIFLTNMIMFDPPIADQFFSAFYDGYIANNGYTFDEVFGFIKAYRISLQSPHNDLKDFLSIIEKDPLAKKILSLPVDEAMNADVQRNLELEQLASEVQKESNRHYNSSGKWFLPYAMAGLQEDQLKLIMREAFAHEAYGQQQSFPFRHDDVNEHDQISRGMDKVISSGEKNIVITSMGPGEEMEEPMNVLRVVLEKLSRLDDTKGYTITIRVYDRSAPSLSEHQAKLPVEIRKVLIEFPKFKGNFKAQVYYGDITQGHAEDTRRWEQMILPSNFIVWRNTWVMDQGLSIDDVRAFADVLQKKIRGEDGKGAGALIVQEYNPRGVDQETLKNPLFHGLVNRVYGPDGSVLDLRDPAMNGGIDLTPDKMNLQTKTDSSPTAQNDGGMLARDDASQGIKFHLDAAQLLRLQNAPGFVPVIINVQPLKSLTEFLGLNLKSSNNPDEAPSSLAKA